MIGLRTLRSARRRGQSGATLIELVVALGAAAILLIPTLAWAGLAIRQQPVTRDGLVRSADTGLLGAYLPEDIAVAGAAENDEVPPSAVGAVEVAFEDCLGGAGDGGRVVLVLLSGGLDTIRTVYSEAPGSDGGGVSVWRRTCGADGTGTESIEAFEDVELDSTEAECDDGSGTTECRQIEFTTQPESGDEPVALAATRRADPASLRVDRTGNRLPVAKIEITSQSPGSPSSVGFSGAASNDPDGTIVSHRWEFATVPAGGAGAPAAQAVEGSGNPGPISRTFNGPGVYYVTLTVTDDDGASNVTYKAVQVDPRSPIAAGSVGPASGIAGSTNFTFNAAGSSDPDGSIVAYRWIVGVEGGSFSQTSGAVTWSTVLPETAVGTIPVMLTVTDNQGRTGTWTTTLRVDAPGGPPTSDPGSTTTTAPPPTDAAPVARFVAVERVPSQWAFDASSSSDDVGIVSYRWTFGGGVGADSGAVTAASFPPGEHTVTLTVTDTVGQLHSTSQLINVGAG